MRYITFILLLLFNAATWSSTSSETSPETLLYDQKNTDHIILVTYTDKSINRIQATATGYRNRGPYQSTAWSKILSNSIEEDYNLVKLTEWPMTTVDIHCVVYHVRENVSVAEVMHKMQQDERIEIVQKLNTFSTQSNDFNDPYFTLQSNLKSLEIDQLQKKTTGKNIKIAVIDTGVDFNHPELLHNILSSKNYAEFFSPEFTSDKHGTAVAGILAAQKNNSTGISGIAPDAELVILKACWPKEANSLAAICNSFTLASALNAAIESGAKILNLSLTGPKDPILELLINKAHSEGIFIVASDTGTGKDIESFPASLPQVFSVKSFSSDADNVNSINSIVAPGSKILTTLPHATYDFISGSSMAAAEVSGILALLLELNPDLTSSEAKSLLQTASLNNQSVNANLAATTMCKLYKCK